MKILMVFTSHDVLGNTGRKTGFWLEEVAAPYYVFREAGVDLTLTSPKGGQPPVDPKSDLPENQTLAMTRFKEDKVAHGTSSRPPRGSPMSALKILTQSSILVGMVRCGISLTIPSR